MKAYLILETGEAFEGDSFSPQDFGILPQDLDRAGEVVFNTSHSGYEEIATDPSYFNQIVVMTATQMGNYGVDRQVWESRKIYIQGFIALQIQATQRDSSWVQLLLSNGVPCMQGLDTRTLVRRLREGGTPLGAIVHGNSVESVQNRAKELMAKIKLQNKDWVFAASRTTTEIYKGQLANGPKIAVLDFGAKENIIRELVQRSSEVAVFPARTKASAILEYQPQGVMLTNGPGDPSDVEVAPQTVQELLGRLPVFGICMGHQILSIALGAQTFKLKFGHRGANHPIKDLLLGQVYMSSQNHGYAVNPKTLPEDVEVTQVNLNDQTVAGIYSRKRNCLGIQYHPESRPGPHEAVKLFDFFVNKMIG
jgi:carbamoyl-phosphate synthase small subunit